MKGLFLVVSSAWYMLARRLSKRLSAVPLSFIIRRAAFSDQLDLPCYWMLYLRVKRKQ